jgi:hypothetical protein
MNWAGLGFSESRRARRPQRRPCRGVRTGGEAGPDR